jgi:hypothetical protein
MILSEAREPIQKALERLAESPRELGCYVIIENQPTGRFVHFCTPPPRSRFRGGSRLALVSEPLIFDGTGNGEPGVYSYIQEPCDVDRGVRYALTTLSRYLPLNAALRIIEESARKKQPS